MELVGAIAAATLLAVFLLPFREYHYWFGWSRIGLLVGLLVYFAAAGAGAGLLGWLIALATVDPTPYPLVNGVIAGVAGALAIRVDIGTREQRDRSQRMGATKAGPELAAGLSLLNIATRWTIGMMDYLVARAIEGWYKQLTDEDLILSANELVEKIRNLDIKDLAKKELWSRFVPAMTELRNLPHEADRTEARVRLEQFCTTYLSDQRWPKPVRSRPAS